MKRLSNCGQDLTSIGSSSSTDPSIAANNNLEDIVIFLGNTSVGKSTLCNSIFQQPIFPSGIVESNQGITNGVQRTLQGGKYYVEIQQQQAAQEIEKTLQQQGNYKIIFVATIEKNRIRSIDLATINTICSTIQTTHFEYGLIINKATQTALKKINEAGGIEKFLKDNLNKQPIQMICISFDGSLYDEENVFFPANSQHQEELIKFIANLPTNKITSEHVYRIDIQKFEVKVKEIEAKYEKQLSTLNQKLNQQEEQLSNQLNQLTTLQSIHKTEKDALQTQLTILQSLHKTEVDELRSQLSNQFTQLATLQHMVQTQSTFLVTIQDQLAVQHACDFISNFKLFNTCNQNGHLRKISNASNEQILAGAAESGHLDAVKYLLDKGTNPDGEDEKDANIPLCCAALNGHIVIVQLLLDRNADIRKDTTNQGTPLHCAALNGHTAIVQLLLNHKANVNAGKDTHQIGTPLHCATINGYTAVAQLLLDHKANINACNKYHCTSLYQAVSNEKTEIVRWLLQKGADRDIRSSYEYGSRTPADVASKEEIKMLLKEYKLE